MHIKFLPALVSLVLAALALTSCSGAGDSSADESASVTVLTTTNVYADLVRQVAKDAVEVKAIINSSSQDPHSYEASSADRLAVKDADLVVLNGGGYDQFLEDMAGVDRQDQAVLNVVKISGKVTEEEYEQLTQAHTEQEHQDHDHADFNEHLWYDLPSMKKLVASLADQLSQLLPQEEENFRQAAEDLNKKLTDLEEQCSQIAAQGKSYLATEPVPAYLLDAAGFQDQTPADLTSAVESGSDIAPLTLQEAKDALKDGSVSLLAYNEQTATAQTQQILAAAQEAKTAHVSFTETLPEGQTYLGWMEENISNIKKAVA
ncbi:MAG: zinc ABC transporter substrate-binding protein [Rothia sp. (in: high G+C Gram-positive bacteria)]|nr:zinc ABC transporter substrate-binding protein [Rothia sp. (in: high G+C Gram-positive bacteria)]